MNDDRARPGSVRAEAFLAEANRAGRGRLKLFLGAAPGVGKTYAMLEAAHRRQIDGVDVVVGVVETHGRRETQALLRDLELVPRKVVTYRGRHFPELDLDAVLARRPALVLIDELAHSNLPAVRNLKRFQDVEELLAAGIDVYTTMNVQHLESLNDVVERISKVQVRETVPDRILELADEIELIDLPPDDLLQRLREGKVYVPEQARQAIDHFFGRGNLTALRELALRVAAERVDQQMLAYMRTHGVSGPWPARERLLVCLLHGRDLARLVRAGKRMADRRRVTWTALAIVDEEAAPELQARVERALRLAEQLGAETATLAPERDEAGQILAFARSQNATHIVVGRPAPGWRLPLAQGPAFWRRLIDGGDAFELTVIGEAEEAGRKPRARPEPALWGDYLVAAAGVAVATLAAHGLAGLMPLANLSLVYLGAVLYIAARAGRWPSIAAAGMSFVAYNFFFTEPYHTFVMDQRDEIVTLVFFLLVAVVTGTLAARIREQVTITRRNARRTEKLYDFSRRTAAAANLEDVLWAVVNHASGALDARAFVLLPSGGGRLEVVAAFPPEDEISAASRAAAEWAWRNDRTAGRGSDTLPGAELLFVPLRAARGPVGLVGLGFEPEAEPASAEQRRLIEAVADQAAVVIERALLAGDIADARVQEQSERLRQALLSSVSHDLRTPLVTVIGAASSLRDLDSDLDPAQRRELLDTILSEADRLNRYIQNLLDMTRLGYGALRPNRDWVGLEEPIGRAVAHAGRPDGAQIVRRLDPAVPLVFVDPVLIEQVIVNLLDNALAYAPEGSIVEVATRLEPGCVVLNVTDQGSGIPTADREQVFDLFHRVRSGDRRNGGTGMGLAICRGFVEAHGGRIAAVDGPEGRGARFEVRLPLPIPPPQPALEAAEA